MFLILLVVMFLAFQNYAGYSFLIGYNTMIFILLALNTMSLDEYNKSSAFLMTLPIKRETYVLEKYILMSGFSLAGAVLTMLLCMALHRETALQLLAEALLIYVVMLFFQLLMLPIQLKFGGEKGRAVLICFLACITVITTSLVKSLPKIFGMQGKLGEALRNGYTWFALQERGAKVVICCLVIAVFGTASYLVSCGIMRRKEF